MPRQNKFIIVSLLLLTWFSGNSQECGNCKLSPSLAQYDLDIQVPQPQLKDEKTQGWLEWLQLFWLSKHANGYLYKNNKNCIRFTQPASTTSGSDDIMHVGMSYANLPPQGDVSRFGNYLTTGSVRKSGNGYIMCLEVQAACSGPYLEVVLRTR